MSENAVQEASLREWASGVGARILVLFGSGATGGSGPMGDVDLALELSQFPSPRRRLEIIRELQAILDPRRADVAFLHRDMDPVLRFEIFSKGRVLHEGEPGLMVEERVRAFREYDDALPFRRLLRRHLRELAKEGSLVP